MAIISRQASAKEILVLAAKERPVEEISPTQHVLDALSEGFGAANIRSVPDASGTGYIVYVRTPSPDGPRHAMIQVSD